VHGVSTEEDAVGRALSTIEEGGFAKFQ